MTLTYASILNRTRENLTPNNYFVTFYVLFFL